MKKILYPIIGFILLCFSYTLTDNKRFVNKKIEEKGTERLILKPFNLFGLLWSCSPGEVPETNPYNSQNGGGSNGGGGGSNGGNTNSDGDTANDDNSTSHTSHYSQYHSSHSSHYSGSHQSHQSHQSHSSHYSAR